MNDLIYNFIVISYFIYGILRGQIEKIFCSPDFCSVIRATMIEKLVHLRDLGMCYFFFKSDKINDEVFLSSQHCTNTCQPTNW